MNVIDQKLLGTRVKTELEKRDMTTTDLAAFTKLSLSTRRKVVAGTCGTVKTLNRVCSFLKIPISEITSNENEYRFSAQPPVAA